MTSDDRLIFALKGLAFYKPGDTSSMERIADFELDIEGTRMNDGRVDPFGRFLVGGYHSDPEKLVSSMYSAGLEGWKVVCENCVPKLDV